MADRYVVALIFSLYGLAIYLVLTGRADWFLGLFVRVEAWFIRRALARDEEKR